MDRRTLLALFLCLILIQIWTLWLGWGVEYEELPQPPPEVARTEPAPPPAPEPAPPPPPPPDPDLPPVEEVAFNFCDVRAVVTTDGGYLRNARLTELTLDYEIQPLWSWALSGFSGPWQPYGEPEDLVDALSPEARALGMGSGDLNGVPPRMAVIERGDRHLVLQGTTEHGIQVRRSLRVGADCVLMVEASWHNPSPNAFAGPLWLSLHDVLPDAAGWWGHAARPWAHLDDTPGWFGRRTRVTDVSNLEQLIEPERHVGDPRWFGVMSNYFGTLVVPEAEERGELWFSPTGPEGARQHGQHYVVGDGLAAGQTVTESFRVFIGPKELDRLRAVDPALDSAVQLGWFGFFGRILLWLLKVFYGITGNWGLSIILLTVLVKAIFFPLTQVSFKSSQAMQALQPKLQAIREEFKDSPEELNRRTFALFREHGVNPVGGCLPMLVQLPVWIALYNVLLSSVELYHTEFLYLRDLSSVDPYLVMPAVVVILMMVQQQLMPMGNLDPAQQRIMKLMPLLFGVFFFTFPSGLVLYIFVNMVLTILQQWYIKRTYKGPGESAAAPA